MKFVVSSSDLLNHLQSISRVISSKNTLPILDHFLFQIADKQLTISASDLETTLITRIALENASSNGSIAVPSKLLLDTLKSFSEQPLSFDVNADTMAVVISSQNGKFTIVGQNASEFPSLPKIKDDKKHGFKIEPKILEESISKTIFATADDELRIVMNGIFIDLNKDEATFVASDAHKLVRYKRGDVKPGTTASFILPKKPAALLKNILGKEEGKVQIDFDEKNAFFTLTDYRMVCRLTEGNYPSYNSVIPTSNPNKMLIDRVELLNALKRVSIFSNQASNLIKLQLSGNQIMVSAQDIDFSISAYERLKCQYDGTEMEIGFKSSFLIEILSNLAATEVAFEMSDPSRAGIILPVDKENAEEDVLMLLMPMMINA